MGLAAQLFMFVEGRRLGVHYVWLYIVGGAVIAIGVAFPPFLIARQLVLSAQEPAS